MKLQSIAPTGQSQAFEVNETFFSTTDARGVITSGNQVFCRTSGYTWSEMVGQPHNLIRHPDMPRQVFRQLWEAARARRPFMGYVKNQAKNGNHYWVFAVVVPMGDALLSVRIKPTSPLLAAVEQVYARLLACEKEAIAGGASESKATAASASLLESEIKRLGFATYENFSHHALNTEVKSRDREIAARGLQVFPADIASRGELGGQLQPFYRQTLATYEGLNALFTSLDSFMSICNGIRERKDAVQAIAEEFRLNALNAHIAANPLGETGLTLGTVAQILNGHGQSLGRNVTTLATNIATTTTAVADTASNLSSARIQLEMLLSFIAEIAAGGKNGAATTRLLAMAQNLRDAFATTLDHAVDALNSLERQIPSVLVTKELLRKDIIYLQVAQISGLTEVARIPQAEASGLKETFTGLRDQIETGKRELDQLGGIVEHLKSLTSTTPPKVQGIRQAMRAIHVPLELAKAA